MEGPGNYSVKISENGCDVSGKLKVSYVSKPAISFTKDTSLCITQQWLLDASYPQSTYLWQDGSTGPTFTITKAGTYSVTVSNICGETDGTVDVTYEDCACKIYVPNAFIPGNGGANNLFRPRFICLMSGYELKIFNRWGQLVFNTQTPEDGWDGTLKGTLQSTGTYVWMMKYKDDLTANPR